MAAAAMGAQIAGSAIGAVGQIYSGNAQGAAADFNANKDSVNAGLVEQQGAEEARRQSVRASQQIGTERAAIGASGVAMGGSALAVLRESASNAALDNLTIKHNADLKAYAYNSDAALERSRAGSARTSGYFGAAATLLKGVGSAAGGRASSSSGDDE